MFEMTEFRVGYKFCIFKAHDVGAYRYNVILMLLVSKKYIDVPATHVFLKKVPFF